MNNSTPVLEGDGLLDTQLELVTPTTVSGTLYGIAFTLFCLYVHALVPRLQDPDRKRQAMFMLVYSAVIMLCGLYNLVANAWVTQGAYIKHGSYPGGPYSYILTTFHTPIITIGITCQLVTGILTSAIQIWRVWVVWSATRYANWIIVLPSMCFLTFIAMPGTPPALNLRTVTLETTLPFDQATQPNTATQTAEIALQGATTILCTALISLFLLFEQRRQSKLIGKGQGSVGYLKITAILIESYALESIWLLIEASLAGFNVVEVFFTESEIYIVTIAYLLVLYQIASGKSCESQRGQSHMSSLHWNHSDHPTTQFEVTSEADGNHDESTKPAASDVLPVSSMA